MIVSDLLPGGHALSRMVAALMGRAMVFKPRFAKNGPWETWWNLPPALVVEFLGVLGFEKAVVTYHTQRLKGRRMPMYTVVGTRTKPTIPLIAPMNVAAHRGRSASPGMGFAFAGKTR